MIWKIVLGFAISHCVFTTELYINTRIKEKIKSYEQNLESSISLDKQDKVLMNDWTMEFQLKRINVTTKHRVMMNKHKEHNFRISNTKWFECVQLHKKAIRKSDSEYLENESGCLTTTTVDDAEKIRDVEQVEKEMRKWRRGYRYLSKICREENPNNENAAEACLVQYMEKDNFSQVIQKLIVFKLQVMGELYLHYYTSISNLDECLNNQFSTYLDSVRSIMETLGKCYDLKKKVN